MEQRGKPATASKASTNTRAWRRRISTATECSTSSAAGAGSSMPATIKWATNIIDASYSFSRAAAGQLKKGGRPEVVLVVGDGAGPLNMVRVGQGHLGRTQAARPAEWPHPVDRGLQQRRQPRHLLCGDAARTAAIRSRRYTSCSATGKGTSRRRWSIRATTCTNRRSPISTATARSISSAKPYNWDTPRLDIWLNQAAR